MKSIAQVKPNTERRAKLVLNSLTLVCLSLVFLSNVAEVEARDFGKKGHLYQILEQPFLEMIDERGKKVDIAAERKKMEKIARDRIENPKPVGKLTPARKGRIFYHDPTYVLKKDIILPCGKLLYRAGTSVNPLEKMREYGIGFDRRLYFVDAREKAQLDWLKQELKRNRKAKSKEEREELEEIEKIILVGGSPLKLEKKLSRSIYFDQGGVLVKKFGIKHSPALVLEDGSMLKIEEFKLNKGRRK
jgi:conjugal transfer pilus assembly protein TraW